MDNTRLACWAGLAAFVALLALCAVLGYLHSEAAVLRHRLEYQERRLKAQEDRLWKAENGLWEMKLRVRAGP